MRILLLITALLLCLLVWDFAAERYQARETIALNSGKGFSFGRDPSSYSLKPHDIAAEIAPMFRSGSAQKAPCNGRRDV